MTIQELPDTSLRYLKMTGKPPQKIPITTDFLKIGALIVVLALLLIIYIVA